MPYQNQPNQNLPSSHMVVLGDCGKQASCLRVLACKMCVPCAHAGAPQQSARAFAPAPTQQEGRG